jgi:hemoglobin-like flavoprotein
MPLRKGSELPAPPSEPDDLISGVIERSLFAVAESSQDITPIFYRRFFALHPDQEELFAKASEACGPMVNEILENLLALASGESWVQLSIDNQVSAHRCYGNFALSLYRDVLDVFVSTLAELAGKHWSAEFDAAWRQITGEFYALIAKAH